MAESLSVPDLVFRGLALFGPAAAWIYSELRHGRARRLKEDLELLDRCAATGMEATRLAELRSRIEDRIWAAYSPASGVITRQRIEYGVLAVALVVSAGLVILGVLPIPGQWRYWVAGALFFVAVGAILNAVEGRRG